MGTHCLREEVSEGQEGESFGEAWIQDSEGQVWHCQKDPQEQEGWDDGRVKYRTMNKWVVVFSEHRCISMKNVCCFRSL